VVSVVKSPVDDSTTAADGSSIRGFEYRGWSCWLVDISRKVHVWSLLAAEADRCGQPISVAVACHAAVRVLAVDRATVAAVGPGDLHVLVFATSPLGRRLEELESTLGEGPGLRLTPRARRF
jgi:hypothetical protein